MLFRSARALFEASHKEEAFSIAEKGLSLPYTRELAVWLREVALEAGDRRRTLLASKVAIIASPVLDEYKALETLSEGEWFPLREEIIADVASSASSYNPQGQIDILLYESLWSKALGVIENIWDSSLVSRTVNKLLSHIPANVIPLCKKRAEAIMDAGQSARYEEAASWVSKSRDAYLLAQREVEWKEYKAYLLALHGKKYKQIGRAHV